MNIYVGNLSFNATEEQLSSAFGAYGKVAKVSIIKDKFTGESRGFGFVEMPDQNEATSAINGLNGSDLNGRTMNVNEARPRAEGDRPGARGGARGGGRGSDSRGGRRGW